MSSSRKSVGVRVAWISGIFLIVAAIIGGLFAWLSPKPPGATALVSGANNQGPVTVAGAPRDITINYNVPATETKEAIAALEEKLKGTNTAIELTRSEVKLLARALTDLDQRTSGITKLPDGRTSMGGFIGGEPRIVMEEHEAATQAFNKKEYSTALEHSKKAIGAYEDAAKIPRAASTGDLTPDSLGKIYFLGAILAATNRQLDTALMWIKKADAANPKPEYKAYQVAVLSDWEGEKRHELCWRSQ
jgi:tetratricopeptide (TPR) repeat protein